MVEVVMELIQDKLGQQTLEVEVEVEAIGMCVVELVDLASSSSDTS